MESQEFKELYQIDRKRLLDYYDRINKQSENQKIPNKIAKFLNNQSIGPPKPILINILNYYREKLINGKNLLDFALEMIRANKIRLEYKKYLSQATHDNIELAIDDCIFLFFIEYDKYIRNLFTNEIKEFEISSLYEVFFRPQEGDNILDIYDILEKYKMKVPTVFYGNQKFTTNIITLRSGLCDIIKQDYQKLHKIRKKGHIRKNNNSIAEKITQKLDKEEFRGLLIERMIKGYCISKNKISPREIENAVSQFLSSFFKLGELYQYSDFRDLLIESFAKDMYQGLTEKVKSSHSLDYLRELISIVLEDFNKINKNRKLDGTAWREDLKPILKKFLIDFIDNIFD